MLSRIFRGSDLGRRLSLRSWLVALIILVLLPTLAALALSLMHASRSYQAVSERHLQETARVFSQSVARELSATAQLLANAAVPGEDSQGIVPGSQYLLHLRQSPSGAIMPAGPVPANIPLAIVLQAADTGAPALSDILRTGNEPLLALAVPRPAPPGGPVEVVALLTQPANLVRTLLGQPQADDVLVAAITDGTGHIIARSINADSLVGKPVPDWASLRALGGHTGTFAARTLEGSEVIFAFHSISGTPGWVAVVGESLTMFNNRASQPVRMMVAASIVTVLGALLLASLLARRILRPIQELAQRARDVARTDPLNAQPLAPTTPSPVAEFESLRRSLDAADAALRRSARAEREAALAATASGRRYRDIAQISALAFWVRDATGAIIPTAGLRKLTGLDDSEVLGDDWQRHIHPDDRGPINLLWARSLESRQPIDVEFRLMAPDRGWRWLRSRGVPVSSADGTTAEWIGVLEDITPRKNVEQALQRSYETLREAERLARIGNWRLDLETKLFTSSEMLHELNGTDPAAPPVSLADLSRMIQPGSLSRLLSAVEQCSVTGKPFSVEVEHLRPDGTSFPAHVRGQALRDEAGQIIALSGTVQDTTERHEERARLGALADNLPGSAIYRVEEGADRTLRVAYISNSIHELIGVPANAILASRDGLLSVIHPTDRAAYEAALANSRRDLAVMDISLRVVTRDGRDIWVHMRAAPRRSPDGHLLWDGLIRDTTQEREVAEALRQAKETAEAAERSKSSFLAMMSHEIRTPMNTVLGMTRLVLRTELPAKQRNYLEKVNASAQSLLGIIDDILDFSRLEAGRLPMEDTAFSLDAVLEQVFAVTAMRAEEKGLEIAYRLAPDTPRHLLGDAFRLGQILTNLVSNAVKFTTTGEVMLSVSRVEEPATGPTLRFAVRDTGIGLSEAQVANLFKPFVQADADTARRFGGTGLGLAICRLLVEQMGGRIWVESTPGKGSVFLFTIPARPTGEAASAPLAQDTPGTSPLTGCRLLVVEDNLGARDILLDMARGFGMAATGASGGRAALALLIEAADRGEAFDIVLTDWRMPDLDGIEVARMIRAEPRLQHLPAVLMVTAFAREEVAQSVDLLGLQGLLIKPITESAFLDTFVGILDPGLSIPASPPTAGVPDALRAKMEGRRVLVVDDNALNREVARDFLTDAGVLVDTVANGLEALQRLRHQNYDAVLMDVHMPGMNGLVATREIRRHPQWARLPVIALTAQARGEDREASLAAGMTAHLTKPIDENQLYRVLAETMEGAWAAPTPPSSTTAEEGRGEGLDMALVMRRLGGRQERTGRLLRGFLQDFSGGGERLAAHVRAGQAHEAATLAHTVRGSATYLGAEAFCDITAQLERAILDSDAEAQRRLLPFFNEHLNLLLNAIRWELGNLNEGPEPKVEAAQALLDRALPLAERGDYAAMALLERLVQVLEGEARELASQAVSSFDELDLPGALRTLHRLRATLLGAEP